MMKRSLAILGTGLIASSIYIFGQRAITPIPQDDLKTVTEQAEKIFKLTDPLGEKPAESTVALYNSGGRICYGISIGGEEVIAKWSDLIGAGPVFVSQGDGKSLATKPKGYYPDQDLVLLGVAGLTAPAIHWGKGDDLEEGRILVSVNDRGSATSLGVVSVGLRSLREDEEGFLGVEMNARWKGKGIKVRAVEPDGAAEAAGLRAGDVITDVGDDRVDGLLEMQTRIRRFKAGETVKLSLLRGDRKMELAPTLKGYDLGRRPESRRLRRMDRMSGGFSRVRDDFPSVLQSDMEVDPDDSGSPVVDLDGNVIGMVIARADRVSTLILPAEEIERVLKTEPEKAVKPEIARQRVVPEEEGEKLRQRGQNEKELEPLRRELREMRRMMEEMSRRGR